jgi:hypothetical protein
MRIQFVSGDLFVNRFGAQALAHGCNCHGAMGAGIAVGFRERYPATFLEYRRRCTATPHEFNPGDCFLWRDEARPWVFNLARSATGATAPPTRRSKLHSRRCAAPPRLSRSARSPSRASERAMAVSPGARFARLLSRSLPTGPATCTSTRSTNRRCSTGYVSALPDVLLAPVTCVALAFGDQAGSRLHMIR